MDQQESNEGPPAGKPSQAEGERAEDARSPQQDLAGAPGGHPSQAEGDREATEADLEEQG